MGWLRDQVLVTGYPKRVELAQAVRLTYSLINYATAHLNRLDEVCRPASELHRRPAERRNAIRTATADWLERERETVLQMSSGLSKLWAWCRDDDLLEVAFVNESTS